MPRLKPGAGRLRFFAALLGLAALSFVSPALARGASRQAATPAASLGQHVVADGETLYCVGRAYGVRPDAIAEANGLTLFAVLTPGRVLTIPAVQWTNIPPGPVCAAQFVSPYPGLPTATLTPTRAPTVPTPTASAAASLGRHVVVKGESLYCIGRAYGVRPDAIAAANRLAAPYRLSPGQALTIPAVRWTFIPRGLVCRAQFASPFVSAPVGTLSPPGGGAGAALTPTDLPGLATKTPQPTRIADTKTPSPTP